MLQFFCETNAFLYQTMCAPKRKKTENNKQNKDIEWRIWLQIREKNSNESSHANL